MLMHSDLSHSFLLDVNDVTSVNRLLSTFAGCPPPLSTCGSNRKLKGRGSSRCKMFGVLITIGIMAGISNQDGAVHLRPSSERKSQSQASAIQFPSSPSFSSLGAAR